MVDKVQKVREKAETLLDKECMLKHNTLQRSCDSIKCKNTSDKLATNRLKKLCSVEENNSELKDPMGNSQTYIARDFKKIRESRSANKVGGAHV